MKYFISDCHIGDGGSVDEFNIKAPHFVRLIDHIMKEKVGDEVQELILLGDFIDFLESQSAPGLGPNPSYDELAVHQLEHFVFKAHPEIFDAMSRFLSAGNSIFYVWGNHDYPLRFGNVNEALAQRILKTTRDRTDYGKFTVGDYYLSHRMNLFAEHGHRFDQFNLHHNAHDPLGTLLVRDFIRKWETRCYRGDISEVFGDRMAAAMMTDIDVEDCHTGELRPFAILRSVRPRANVLPFIQRLVRLGILPLEIQEDMLHDLSHVLNKAGRGAEGRVLDWMGQPGLKGLRSLVVKFRSSDDTPKMLRHGAEHELKNIHNEHDLDFVPNVCILGHSHFIDARVFPSGEFIPLVEDMPLYSESHYYFNIASWVDVTLIDRQGRVGIHYRECPFLRLREDSSGVVRADIRDAAQPDMPPIDIEKYRRRYLEYETDYE